MEVSQKKTVYDHEKREPHEHIIDALQKLLKEFEFYDYCMDSKFKDMYKRLAITEEHTKEYICYKISAEGNKE